MNRININHAIKIQKLFHIISTFSKIAFFKAKRKEKLKIQNVYKLNQNLFMNTLAIWSMNTWHDSTCFMQKS